MTILNKIIKEKKKEVEQLRKQTYDTTKIAQVTTSFKEYVQSNNNMSIIAEFKRASPSKGIIRDGMEPNVVARCYAESGAAAMSVLTDTPFFQGTMEDLEEARSAVDLPILCKDFIIDRIQIDRAIQSGATMILLIAAALDDEKMQSLFTYAKERELEILCEVHNEEEMKRVLHLEASIIGINNRNLKTFNVDLTTTKKLAGMVDNEDVILVSESGIQTKEDVQMVATYGAKAILVGETLMRSNNINETMNELQILLPTKTEVP